MNRFPVRLSTLVLGLVLAATVGFPMGCGGGHGSSSVATGNPSAARVGRATISITWPKQTRLIPDASQSIVVHLEKDGALLTSKTFARPAEGGTVTADFGHLPLGTVTATATAYPKPDGTGTAQAQASTDLDIVKGEVTPFSLTMESTITHLRLLPADIQLTIGQTRKLTATPINAVDAVVLISPANLIWQSSNPAAATVSSAGVVTAVASGTATITAKESESGKSASTLITCVTDPGDPGDPPGPPGMTEPQFELKATYSFSATGDQFSTADQAVAADFDADGKADVAIGTDEGLMMYYGKGDGTLETPIKINEHTTFGARCAADVNKDGHIDLLCGDNNGVYLFLNQGGRNNFAFPPININIERVMSVDTVQMPGQPNLDIVACTESHSGQFGEGKAHHLRLQGNTLVSLQNWRINLLPIFVGTGDLNNDGIPDLVVTNFDDTAGPDGAIMFPGQSDGLFGDGGGYNDVSGTAQPYGIDIADYNNDGKNDLAVANYWDGDIGLLLNTGTTLDTTRHYPCNGYPRYIRTADFDKDGWRDMAVANASGVNKFTVVWNRGDTFLPIGYGTPESNNRSLDIADFNNDGKTDIVVSSEDTGAIAIFLNTTP